MKDLTDNCTLGADEAVDEEMTEEEAEDIDEDVDGARRTIVPSSDEELEEL